MMKLLHFELCWEYIRAANCFLKRSKGYFSFELPRSRKLQSLQISTWSPLLSRLVLGTRTAADTHSHVLHGRYIHHSNLSCCSSREVFNGSLDEVEEFDTVSDSSSTIEAFAFCGSMLVFYAQTITR